MGFTLIELLVVIAIIALLLAILMPALGKVKEAGYRTVCAAHMHDLSLAIRIYADGEDDTLPSVCVRPDGTVVNSQSVNHWARWWMVMDGSTPYYWNLGLLWKAGVTEGNGKIFFCPSPKATYQYKDYADQGFPTEIEEVATGIRVPYYFNPECFSVTDQTRKYKKTSHLNSRSLLLLDLLTSEGIAHGKGWNVLKGDGSVAFSIEREVQEIIENSGTDFNGTDFRALEDVIELFKR